MQPIAVLLAEGFEEIEAIAIIDTLRRAEFTVTTAGLAGISVTGAHTITIQADTTLAKLTAATLGAVVLPGGMPGAANLAASSAVITLLQQVRAAGKPVAAICAAPLVLDKAGLIKGKRITCYPGFESQCTSATVTSERVQVDGDLVTARGPGAAIEFALALITLYGKPDTAAKLRQAMIVK